MNKYFASVQFVIGAETEEAAENVQQDARAHLLDHYPEVIDAHADEPVEVHYGN